MRRQFSNHSFVGFMSENFDVLWSNNRLLFHRFHKGSKKIQKFINNNPTVEKFNHQLRVEGIWYDVYAEKLDNKWYACRLAREISDENLNCEELTQIVDNINGSILDIYSYVEMILAYADESDYMRDKFHENLNKIKSEAGNIFSECYNVMNAFDDEYNADYVPFDKYLIRSWDVAKFAVRKLENSFDIQMNIVFPYVKLDYSKFELALFNIIRLVLMYSKEDDTPIIKIKTLDFDKIEVSVDFEDSACYDISHCNTEIRAIKHIFRKMGGDFELQYSDDFYHAYGVFKCECTLDSTVMKNGMDIVYSATPEIIERKKECPRYIKIYDNVNRNLRLASEVTELSDIKDSYEDIIERFFSKVYKFRS